MRALALVITLAMLLASGCTGSLGGDGAAASGRAATAAGDSLSALVLERAAGIAPQNRPYVYNGVQDCYGFVRQVVNPLLIDGTTHPEDYWPNAYNRARWVYAPGGLPSGDAPSADWVYFSDASELLPGDVLATAQGHAWGDNWHGGLFAGWVNGQPRQWDNTVDSVGNGAYQRRLWSGFRYYYRPFHEQLAQVAPAPAAPAPQPEPEPTANQDGMTAGLHGTVTVAGTPTAGLQVSAWGHDEGDSHLTTTDGGGVYAFRDLRPGSLYNVVVNANFNAEVEGAWQLVDEGHAFAVRNNVSLASGPDGWHGEDFTLEY